MAGGWRDRTERMLGAVSRSFGESATYTCARTSRQYTVECVWSAPHAEIDVGANVAVNTGQPSIGVLLADLAFTPEVNDRAVLSNVTYKVTDVQLDGMGWANLSLQKVAR